MVKSPYHCVVDEQEGYKELKKKGSGWLCQLLPLPRLPHAGIKETFTCLSSNFLEGEDLLGITCLGLENSDKGLITLGAQQGGSISESDIAVLTTQKKKKDESTSKNAPLLLV
jgi:hypothetical protein